MPYRLVKIKDSADGITIALEEVLAGPNGEVYGHNRPKLVQWTVRNLCFPISRGDIDDSERIENYRDMMKDELQTMLRGLEAPIVELRVEDGVTHYDGGPLS